MGMTAGKPEGHSWVKREGRALTFPRRVSFARDSVEGVHAAGAQQIVDREGPTGKMEASNPRQ
jgi:hypothetical protein